MSKASWEIEPLDKNSCRPAYDLLNDGFDDNNQ